MASQALCSGHVDHIWEVLPGHFLLTGWCTDQGADASLQIVYEAGWQDVQLGCPRVSRPDVCQALHISDQESDQIGFFVAITLPSEQCVVSLILAGQTLPWQPQKLDLRSRYGLILQWVECLNWGFTPLEALPGFLAGYLGVALSWINQPSSALQWSAGCCGDHSAATLILKLPTCADLVWLQLWRLALQSAVTAPSSIHLSFEARASALGDPDHIVAELLKNWSLLCLPKPSISINGSASLPGSTSISDSLLVMVDARRWLLPLSPWWEAVSQLTLAHGNLLSAESLVDLGFEPIDWMGLKISEGLSDQWAWQLQIDQWLNAQ